MKKYLAIAAAGVMALSIAGCAGETTDDIYGNDSVVVVNDDKDATVTNTNGDKSNDENRTDGGYYISPTDDIEVGGVITVGEIMQFDGDYIHIIAGDLVEVFEYDAAQAEGFYLAQTIQLIKGEDKNSLEPFIIEDFSVRHTNMGHPLDSASGIVTSVEKEMVSVEVEGKEIELITYEEQFISVGTEVSVVYMTFGDNEAPSLIALYNEDSKLELTVKEISRGEEGRMLLAMTDVDGGEYSVNLSSGTVELNISEVAVGDVLIVYHEGIMESWPMQVQNTLITK